MNNFIENHYEKCSHDIKNLLISNGFFTIIGLVMLFFLEPFRNVLLFDFFFEIYNFCVILYLKFQSENEHTVHEKTKLANSNLPEYL